MTREEAIINLKLSQNRIGGIKKEEWNALQMAIEALSAEAETKCIAQFTVDVDKIVERIKEEYDITNKWILCSERLPDAEYGEGDSVLCCTESGLMYILYWHGGNWCVPTGEPHHWVNHKTGWHDKVIAWLPLPKPYREDGEV